jgi:hypothetical protein
MPDEPYRPAPTEPNPELEKLAAEGRARIQAANRAAPAPHAPPADLELRAALGSRYVSPLRAASYASFVLGVVLGLVGFVGPLRDDTTVTVVAEILGMLLLAGGIAVSSTDAAKRASAAQVGAERRWVQSLPFAMNGYFEVLEGPAEKECRLLVELEWLAAPAPADETILGVWGLHDTGVRIDKRVGSIVTIRSGPISGNGVQLSIYWIYDNRSIPRFVHGLVDRVLVPIHRSQPLARVSLRRQ